MYGSEVFGIYSISQTVLLITALLCRLGFDTGCLRLFSEYYAKKDFSTIKLIYLKIVKLVLPLSLVASLILYNLSHYIAISLFDNLLLTKPLEYISFAIIPFTFLLIHSEGMRGVGRIVFYSLFRTMSLPLFTALLIMIFYNLNLISVDSPVLALLISIFLLSFLSSLIIKKILNVKEKNNNDISYKKMLKISLPMLLTGSMFYLLQWADTLILGFYLDESEVGIYNVCIKISLITTILLFSINSYAAPKFSENFTSNNFNELKKIIYYSTNLMFYSSIPILILILIFSKNILSIFGSEYEIAKNSLVMLSLGQFVNALSGSVGYILQMTNNQKLFQYIMLFTVFLNIVLNIILIPSYGIDGAAFASMLSYILWNLLGVLFIYKRLSILTLYIPKFLRK